jgi:N-acetylmuramoyl-L-alanine amidase
LSRKRVLIQAGHVAPREPGFEGGTGTVREQELSLALQSRLARRLLADGRFDVTRSPGDIPNGWTGDLFISLHGDGSGSDKASGFCFGFPPGSAESARFAALVRREFERIAGYPTHRKDNYTGNLTGYYGWRRTNAPAKVLIEHGFLTNPNERAFLFSHLAEIALAEYRAILAYFGYSITPKPREPVIVNTPLEEAIALIEASAAFKNKHRRILLAWKKLTALRKKK